MLKKIKQSIKWKLVIIVVLIITALISFLSFIFYQDLKENLYNEKRHRLMNLTDSAMGVLTYYHNLVENGELTSEQAKNKAKNQIKTMLYGDNNQDYFWINDHQPKMIMHPFKPGLIDEDLSNIKDKKGDFIFNNFVEVVEEKEQGFVEYYWQYYDDVDRVEPKLSYVSGFEPWNWIIGTGIYINDINETLDALRNRLIIMALISLLLSTSLVYYFSRKITVPLVSLLEQAKVISDGDLSNKVPDELTDKSDEIGSLAQVFEQMRGNLKNIIGSIADIANNLSASSEELSASSQEISAASEQVGTAMEEVASGAEEQTAQVEGTTVNMENLDDQIDYVENMSNDMENKLLR